MDRQPTDALGSVTASRAARSYDRQVPEPDPDAAPPRPISAAAVRSLVEGVEGWLSADQVQLLHERAVALAPGASIVEIGSFRGRSTTVLAASAPPGTTVVAIDPHAGNDRGPQEIRGFEEAAATDNEVFEANLARAGVRDRVQHLRAFSDDALEQVSGPIDLLFIDGAHRFGPARRDIRDWGALVPPGGTMAIHDSFSSIGVTLAIVAELVGRRRWRYVGRAGSLAEYRRTEATGISVGGVLRHVVELPWFLRNVVIKVLITARLGRLTRLLGHREPTWPY